MRDDESVKAVVSGHVSVSPVASAEKEGQLKQLKWHSLPKGVCGYYCFTRVVFDLLEDCSGWIEPAV